MPSRPPLSRVTPALASHIGARAHRDPDVRSGQRRRVVDPSPAIATPRPSAEPRNSPPCRPAAPRPPPVDPELARDRLRRAAAVAAQHDDRSPRRAVPRAPPASSALTGSPTRDEAGEPPVDGDEHDRLALSRSPRRRVSGRHRPRLGEQPGVAERHRTPGDVPLTPLPVNDSKSLPRASSSPALPRGRDHRCGQRMLAASLEARRQPQHLVLALARRCHD